MTKEDAENIDPLGLSVSDRTLWLIDRLRHVEALLLGIGDVQKLLIALQPDGPVRDGLRQALTALALSQPPGTLRTQPAWVALGELDHGDEPPAPPGGSPPPESGHPAP